MKKGQLLNGYEILEDFKTAGGGQSVWSFAKKHGKEYFIKQFLAPTYPTDGSPGSDRTKEEKRKRCFAFEQHHRMLQEKLKSRSADGGNLIVTLDFFRSRAKSYKTTAKIDISSLTVSQIAASEWKRKKMILLTVAHSIKILHDAGVVHGDLKPPNILIKETSSTPIAKLIDFDNSYLSGAPPELAENLVGDTVYYSPEMLEYIKHGRLGDRARLQLASDVFALGLIYSEFVTGKLPHFNRSKYESACVAVANGEMLTLDAPGSPDGLTKLVDRMLVREPADRPTIGEVFKSLKSLGDAGTPVGSGPVLRGTLTKRTTDVPTTKKADSALAGGLSGTLMKKKS